MFEAVLHNLTYCQPTIDPQPTQKMSATVCNPVIICLSSISPIETFTLTKNKSLNCTREKNRLQYYNVTPLKVQEPSSHE